MYGPHFVYPFLYDGHLGCFYHLAAVNIAAVKVCVYLSVQVLVFSSFVCIPPSTANSSSSGFFVVVSVICL